jgi:hypothetical protein
MKLDRDTWWPPKFTDKGEAFVSFRTEDGVPGPGVMVERVDALTGDKLYYVVVPRRWKVPDGHKTGLHALLASPHSAAPAITTRAIFPQSVLDRSILCEDLIMLRCTLMEVARANGYEVGDDEGA